MLKKYLQSGFLSIVLGSTVMNLAIGITFAQAISEASINEDSLNTVNGLRWGGQGWPFSRVTDVKDSLVGTVSGRVVIDRHGIDHSNKLFSSPFSGPAPNKIVFVSLWGSNIHGCSAELIIQYATVLGQNNAAATRLIVPKQLEMGINGQIVELSPQTAAAEKRFIQNYTYTTYQNNTNVEHRGTMYMTRNLFVIDAKIANILTNAPPKKVQARITLAGDRSVLFPIGEKTVKRWKDAYSFNPYCRPLVRTQSNRR